MTAATDLVNETSILALKLETRWNEIIAAEFILLLCVFLMAVIGNVIIFVAFCKSARLQTIPNMYLMSFAVADILMTLFVVPLSMGIVVKGKWVYSNTTCQLQGFLTAFLVAVTVLTITLCAVDRCFAVVRPVKYIEFMTQYVVTGLIASSWFFSLIVPSSYFLNGHKFSFHPGYLFCRPDMEEINYTFASILDIFFVVLPLILVVGSYVEIKRRIEIHSKRPNEIQVLAKESVDIWDKDEETARLFGATTIAVLCLWVPFLLVEIIESFEGFYIMPRSLYVVCSLLGLTAFACKVFVYSSVNKELKEEFLGAIKCRRSRRITDISQVESNEEVRTSSRQSNKRIRPKTATQPELDKHFDTEEDEAELLFENRTPTPNEYESVSWGKRSKSRIDSGHFSEGRTIPNTPFGTIPNSPMSYPKRAKSRKENVRFSESPTIVGSPPQTGDTTLVTPDIRTQKSEDDDDAETTTDSPATVLSVGRLLTPAHPNARRVKRDDNLWQSESHGRLTPLENVRKTTDRKAAKGPWR